MRSASAVAVAGEHTVSRFVVIVDDPQKSRAFGYVIEHDDIDEAKREAAARSIIDDPLGCGVGNPPEEFDEATRRAQAREADLVTAVAVWAVAAEMTP
jgi:hypothetical protein